MRRRLWSRLPLGLLILGGILALGGVIGAGSESVRTDDLAVTDPAYQPGDTIPIRPGQEIAAQAVCSAGRKLNTTFWHTGAFGPFTPHTEFTNVSNDDVNGATTRFMVPLDTEPGSYPLSLQCISGDMTRYFTLDVSALPQAEGTPTEQAAMWTFGSADGADLPYAATLLADGGIAIVGSTEGTLEGTRAGVVDAWVAVYEPDGTLRWHDQIGDTGVDVAMAVEQLTGGANDGGLVIAGVTDGDVDGAGPLQPATAMDTWIQIRNVTTGAVTASHQVDGFDLGCNPAGDQFAGDLVALPDGGFVVMGITDTSVINPGCLILAPPAVQPAAVAGFDVYAIRFDAAMNRVREQHFGTAGDELSVTADLTGASLVLAISTDGVFTGANQGPAGTTDVAFLVVDVATGNHSVISQFGGPGSDLVADVLVDGTTVWFAGSSDDSVTPLGLVERPLRTDSDGTNSTTSARTMWITGRAIANGSEAFTRQIDSSGLDCAGSMALDASGRLWVSGGAGAGLTEVTTAAQSVLVVVDGQEIVHAEQFGSSSPYIGRTVDIAPDGRVIAVGGTGGDVSCFGGTTAAVDVVVRIGDPAAPANNAPIINAPVVNVPAPAAPSTTTTTTTPAATSTTTPIVEATVTETAELPATGSDLPHAGLAALLLCGGALLVRLRRPA